MAEVVLLGEPMVVFAADTIGKLEDVETFTRFLAGAEANVAIGLTRLEHRVCYVSKLGKDPFGHFIEKRLQAEGVHTQIAYDKDHLTGFYLKSKVIAADPEVCYFRKNSAASCYGPEDAEWIDLSETKLVHVTGIMPALSESCLQATIRLMERAREKGITVSFDPNLRPPLWSSLDLAKEQMEYGFQYCDILKISDNEIQFVSGKEDYDEGIRYLQEKYQIPLILLTMGKDGSRAYYKGMRVERAGKSVKAIETTGAGDTFCGSSLNYILEHDFENLTEEQLGEMLTFANAAAALITTRKGAIRSMPEKEEVLEFLQK